MEDIAFCARFSEVGDVFVISQEIEGQPSHPSIFLSFTSACWTVAYI